jgi:hypothetical protein
MTERKALVRDYRDRKVEAGAYAVRCLATGEVWVGATPDLATRRSGVWFTLRQGSHSDRALQTAWRTHGEAAFVFEALEAIDDEGLGDLGRSSLLKERRDAWIAQLNARKLNR